jgi:hypothetical protein
MLTGESVKTISGSGSAAGKSTMDDVDAGCTLIQPRAPGLRQSGWLTESSQTTQSDNHACKKSRAKARE